MEFHLLNEAMRGAHKPHIQLKSQWNLEHIATKEDFPFVCAIMAAANVTKAECWGRQAICALWVHSDLNRIERYCLAFWKRWSTHAVNEAYLHRDFCVIAFVMALHKGNRWHEPKTSFVNCSDKYEYTNTVRKKSGRNLVNRTEITKNHNRKCFS